LIKCDIYHYAGELEKAFSTQRQLLLKNDSIRGKMMAENISQMEHDIQMMKHQQEMARLMNIVLAVAVALTILVIILMARNILIRRRSRKKLVMKNAELREANRRVMAADEMKTEFIRSVSHEIRTPLNIINGFTQVLTDEENHFCPEERQQIAETIGTSTGQITSLVNKMLTLANENTKDLLKEVEETDALDICRKALQEMPPVDAKHVKVELENHTDGKGTILCTNSDSLLQMLGNILENSAMCTEKGFIRLTLRNDGEMMWFTIEDTGCGIPEDKVSTIFERFVKVDKFKHGLGLGLAYCHETAERLGGTLRLDYTSEAGTSFTLGLPLKVKNVNNVNTKT
jgi:signal transduction histidine kinase